MPSSGLAIRRVLILKIATCGGTRPMSTGLARRSNKIYAVKVGRVPGIYDSWAEAEAQVEGVLRAKFRSAGRRGQTRADAIVSPPPSSALEGFQGAVHKSFGADLR